MPGRNSAVLNGEYRYGMNGQEKENEITSYEALSSAEYWMYDARLGRRWEVDPIVFEWQSSYATFDNNPIYYSDPLGAAATNTNSPKGGGEKQKDGRKQDLSKVKIKKPNEEPVPVDPPKTYEWKVDPPVVVEKPAESAPTGGTTPQPAPEATPPQNSEPPQSANNNSNYNSTFDVSIISSKIRWYMQALNFKANYINNPNPLFNFKVSSDFTWKARLFKIGIMNSNLNLNSTGITGDFSLYTYSGGYSKNGKGIQGKIDIGTKGIGNDGVSYDGDITYGMVSYGLGDGKIGVGPNMKCFKAQAQLDTKTFGDIISDCWTGTVNYFKSVGDRTMNPQKYTMPNAK